jgi:CRISPR-associated protein Cas5d
VLAHFEWNELRKDLVDDRDENKHHNIAKRAVDQGGRRDIFLGTRECQAYVEPCEFGSGNGFYDGYGLIDFGLMFHGFDYPDETGRSELGVRLWRQTMSDGVIMFADSRKISDNMRRTVHEYGADYSFKSFILGENLKRVDVEEVDYI